MNIRYPIYEGVYRILTSIVRYCSFSFFREDYAETVIVLFLIFRIGLFNNICPYCLPVCPPARRHFSDPL